MEGGGICWTLLMEAEEGRCLGLLFDDEVLGCGLGRLFVDEDPCVRASDDLDFFLATTVVVGVVGKSRLST
jgi:hypothetical protein